MNLDFRKTFKADAPSGRWYPGYAVKCLALAKGTLVVTCTASGQINREDDGFWISALGAAKTTSSAKQAVVGS